MLKKLTSTLLGTGVLCASFVGSASAATFVGSYNGSKYYLTSGPSTWTVAQSEAQSLGGNLVTINNQAEQNWLLSKFGSVGQAGLTQNYNGNRLWIGLNDAAQEGTFVWASGETSSYTNWTPGEPNNGNGVYQEDYVAMNWGVGGVWNDLPNAGPAFAPAYGIIEKVPEPSAVLALAMIGFIGVGTRKKKVA